VGTCLFFSLSFRLAAHYARTRLLFLVDNMQENSFTFLICLQHTSDKKKLLCVFHANRLVYYFTIPICRLSHERQFLNLNFLLDVTAYSLVYKYQRLAGHSWFHRLGISTVPKLTTVRTQCLVVFPMLINLSCPRNNTFWFLFQHKTMNEVQIVKYSAPSSRQNLLDPVLRHLNLLAPEFYT